MDRLDLAMTAGGDLVSRVDAVLACDGIPGGHRVVGLLRAVGALPGDAVAFVAGLDPDAMDPPARAAAGLAERYTLLVAEVDAAARPGGWQGAAAAAFAAQWRAVAGHLTGPGGGSRRGTGQGWDEECLVARLAAMGGYLRAVAGWMRAGRDALAGTLAEALGSAEAVLLRIPAGQVPAGYGPGGHAPARAAAAAELAARLLGTVDGMLTAGNELIGVWRPRLDELRWPETWPADGPDDGGTRLVAS